jgi:hypothetical protein
MWIRFNLSNKSLSWTSSGSSTHYLNDTIRFVHWAVLAQQWKFPAKAPWVISSRHCIRNSHIQTFVALCYMVLNCPSFCYRSRPKFGRIGLLYVTSHKAIQKSLYIFICLISKTTSVYLYKERNILKKGIWCFIYQCVYSFSFRLCQLYRLTKKNWFLFSRFARQNTIRVFPLFLLSSPCK